MTNDKPQDSMERSTLLAHVEGAEKLFLAGRRSREADLESAVRFFLEFLRGFESFTFKQPCVTVFGSAGSRSRTGTTSWPAKWVRRSRAQGSP